MEPCIQCVSIIQLFEMNFTGWNMSQLNKTRMCDLLCRCRFTWCYDLEKIELSLSLSPKGSDSPRPGMDPGHPNPNPVFGQGSGPSKFIRSSSILGSKGFQDLIQHVLFCRPAKLPFSGGSPGSSKTSCPESANGPDQRSQKVGLRHGRALQKVHYSAILSNTSSLSPSNRVPSRKSWDPNLTTIRDVLTAE